MHDDFVDNLLLGGVLWVVRSTFDHFIVLMVESAVGMIFRVCASAGACPGGACCVAEHIV